MASSRAAALIRRMDLITTLLPKSSLIQAFLKALPKYAVWLILLANARSLPFVWHSTSSAPPQRVLANSLMKLSHSSCLPSSPQNSHTAVLLPPPYALEFAFQSGEEGRGDEVV
jgi:hypothetical protein